MSWPTVRLKDIFDIARGGSPRPISDYITDDSGGINWISIKDASNSVKFITETKLKIKKEGVSKSREVKPGDFLLTNSMSFGRPYIMKTTGCIHDGWLVLSGDPEKIDTEYFYHLLGSEVMYRKFSSLAAGAVVKNLNIDLVKSVEIRLPPLEEQKRIAVILDKADAIRRKRQQAIKLADQFLRSVFLDMFGDPVTDPKGWDKFKIGELSSRITKGESPKWQGYNYQEKGVRFITSENVLWGMLDDRKKFIPESFNKKIFRSVLQKNDILINLVGASVGRACLVPDNAIPANINQAVSVVTLIPEKAVPEFMLRQILTDSIQRKLLGNVVDAARANISLANIRDLDVIVPEMKLQNKFLEIARSVLDIRNKFLESDQSPLFQSITRHAFHGKLTKDKAA